MKWLHTYVCVRCAFSSHEMDMRKLKDLNAAAEKLRREKWIDEKTKKIKVKWRSIKLPGVN